MGNPQREFPEQALTAAVESILPVTRRDMSAEEILEWCRENPHMLRQRLREMGHPPEHYEDLPDLVAVSGDVDHDHATVNAVKATEYMKASGPLWDSPHD